MQQRRMRNSYRILVLYRMLGALSTGPGRRPTAGPPVPATNVGRARIRAHERLGAASPPDGSLSFSLFALWLRSLQTAFLVSRGRGGLRVLGSGPGTESPHRTVGSPGSMRWLCLVPLAGRNL